MKVRGHGNAVAIALAALAVVLAATGTAYAVTATTVNIADKTTPANVAKVDSSGRLAIAGAISTLPTVYTPVTRINATTYAYVDDAAYGDTDPTSATLAVTSINYDNSFNRLYANTDYQVQLVKITVGAAGNCYSSDVTTVTYHTDSLPQAQSVSQTFPYPLVFSPTGGKKYCIGVQVLSTDSSHATPYYGISVAIGAYVVSGTYTGKGTAATPGTVNRDKPRLRTKR